MTVDLTPATSLSTVAGSELAPSRGILNSTAHITPAEPASYSPDARDQFSGHAEIAGDVHDGELRIGVGALREPAAINDGHDHTHDYGYYRRLDGTCGYCADTHPAEPDIPMQVFDSATGSWIVESVLSEAA